MLKTILIIVSIIILLIIGHRIYVKKYLQKNQCQGKTDGTSCEFGAWYDSWGRKCGGMSCVGHGIGTCFHGECTIK